MREPVLSWAPPQSLLRIEYSSALLREVRSAGARVDAFGLLFGFRRGQTIHLVATRGRPGLEPLGVFASRVRGGAFLTEDDLQRLDKAAVCVVLVVSGTNAGLFVRDATGAIGTVRSYQEFSTPSSPPRVNPAPLAVKKPKRPRAAICAVVGVGLALVLFPLRKVESRDPVAVNLSDDKGQLRISWNTAGQKIMTILDRGERISLALAPQQSSLTYARRSGDVTVGMGSTQVRFIGPPPPPSHMAQTRANVEALKSRIACLRAVEALGRIKLAALEERHSLDLLPY
jgi:hypothetical protein